MPDWSIPAWYTAFLTGTDRLQPISRNTQGNAGLIGCTDQERRTYPEAVVLLESAHCLKCPVDLLQPVHDRSVCRGEIKKAGVSRSDSDMIGTTRANHSGSFKILRQFGGSYYLFLPLPLACGKARWPLGSVVAMTSAIADSVLGSGSH